MSVNLSKAFLTFTASLLLVAASVMSSDARPHANRHQPTQVESARGSDNCTVWGHHIYPCE